jgi:hypothetical protein
MAEKIKLISNALILIGDLPVTSLSGNTRAETVANNLYDNIVQAEMSKYRWGFARRLAQTLQYNTESMATRCMPIHLGLCTLIT